MIKATEKKISALTAFTKDYFSVGGGPTVYVCQNYICKLPTININKLMEMLLK
ncbi:MAG: hypothetical protein V3V16_06675 [Melioribacteraceae bacterium]